MLSDYLAAGLLLIARLAWISVGDLLRTDNGGSLHSGVMRNPARFSQEGGNENTAPCHDITAQKHTKTVQNGGWESFGKTE